MSTFMIIFGICMMVLDAIMAPVAVMLAPKQSMPLFGVIVLFIAGLMCICSGVWQKRFDRKMAAHHSSQIERDIAAYAEKVRDER